MTSEEIGKIPINAIIKVTLDNGVIGKGRYIDWTSEFDNEPDPESITIVENGTQYEIFLDEIEKIEIIGSY
ncbi:MAG: hypothetical protein FWH20_02210 [Oscillospiraceae bacterium]|nr:hypothetical protein [Oscillospiraceae bacterium]